MLLKQGEYISDLVDHQPETSVAQGIDCNVLFTLMTLHLSSVTPTRRAYKLYSQLQKWQMKSTLVSPATLQLEGLRWLHALARQGYLPVIDYLVKLYQVHPDKSSQIILRRYLRLRVALRSNADDLYALALNLIGHTRSRKNYREIILCLQKAVQIGHRESHLLLAQLYQRGLGVSCSYDQYMYHLEQAAKAGLADAQIALAKAYGQEELFARMDLMEHWLTQAVKQDAPEALYLLGKLWFHQDGDCYSLRVVPLWQRAAQAGVLEACYEVGRMLLTNPKQESRQDEGIRYLCRAAQGGIRKATQLLYQLRYDQSGRYIGVLKELRLDYVATDQTLF